VNTWHFVTFWDRHRKAQDPPDPRYPRGMIINGPGWAQGKCCKVKLPYPAPSCGNWFIECDQCGANAMVTCAGRPDDPKLYKMRCGVKRWPVTVKA
jgi:hypothetical protein